MDIPRPFAARRRRIRHTLYILTAVVSIAAISAGLSRLEPAAPRVDRSTLWMGEVKRGDLTRRVRGLGKLIPEVIRWIPAATQSRVERVLIQPGERVTPETILMELSNAESAPLPAEQPTGVLAGAARDLRGAATGGRTMTGSGWNRRKDQTKEKNRWMQTANG